MEFYDAIRTRRSVRGYRSDPIPDDVLNRVLDAARHAPSGSNRQPTRFIKDLRWIPPAGLRGGKRRFAAGESACCSY